MSNRKYEFKVEGIVPPRNVKSKSMWNDPTEVPRLIEFRKNAYDALNESLPLTEGITLSIKIHLPRDYNKPGDLDNFIKGICDGLMKCPNHPKLKLDETFEKTEHAKIYPKTFAMIEDDEKIVKITATKTVDEDIEEPFYEITIEGK
jgi:Holliday junction resolvase RusA-like endonuclease